MEDLTTLLHEAVEHVEPTDRLAAIRQQTAGRPGAGAGTPSAACSPPPPWSPASPSPCGRPDPGPGPSNDPTAIETPTSGTHAVAAYYLGQTPAGLRLFREFHQRIGAATLDEALAEVSARPDDPNYSTLWVPGGLGPATVRGRRRRRSVDDRRPGMSATEAELSIQQVVYTLQAAAGARLPVLFLSDGDPIDTVYGVPTSEPLANAPQLDVLALVSISNPVEGRVVEDSFSADGVASSFEGTVPWELQDADGNVVRSGFAQTME